MDPMGMEMSKTENVSIPICDDENNDIVREWDAYVMGDKTSQLYGRKRHIEKVPPLLLKGEKGCKNEEYYRPAVVSLGPYHHNICYLAQAENYKLITLHEYCLSSEKTRDFLHNEVFKVIHVARECYIEGSTKDYDDEKFTRMMLHDGCFVLFFIECISYSNKKAFLNNEHLGALGFANVIRDIFLLENQIPFVVLQVLLDLRFPNDKGEQVLNHFFNYLNYGEAKEREEKVLGEKQPLHLLELYREYFISISRSGLWPAGSTTSCMWRRGNKRNHTESSFNYVKRNRSFASVMELKAKGIFLKATYDESSEDIRFHSYWCYGRLELVRRAVSPNSKAIYLNMIAYEMCPHNPNDFRVDTYIRVMKSLVVHTDDVKELRSKNILLHSLGRDEEVVKMYGEIDTPAVNYYMFNQLRKGIERHCNNKCKTWAAELITGYFSSPWKTMALLVATAILFGSFLQTYFSIRPLPDNSNEDIIKLLRRCAHFRPHPTLS